MIKGSAFTIGVLLSLAGVGWVGLNFLGALNSDNVQDTSFNDSLWTGGAALVAGVGLCCVAGFLL